MHEHLKLTHHVHACMGSAEPTCWSAHVLRPPGAPGGLPQPRACISTDPPPDQMPASPETGVRLKLKLQTELWCFNGCLESSSETRRLDHAAYLKDCHIMPFPAQVGASLLKLCWEQCTAVSCAGRSLFKKQCFRTQGGGVYLSSSRAVTKPAAPAPITACKCSPPAQPSPHKGAADQLIAMMHSVTTCFCMVLWVLRPAFRLRCSTCTS